MAQLQLRPFGVGEILDAAFKIYKDRFKTLILITASVVIPLGIIQALLAAQILADPTEASGGTIIGSVLVGVIALVVTQVATAALTLAVADAYLDQESPWQRYLSAAFSRTGAIVGASILFALAVGVGFIGLVVGAIIIGAGLGVFMPAMMVERLGATESLGRAWRLSSGHKGRVFGAWLVAYIIVLIVSAVVSAVVGFGVSTTEVLAQQLLGIVASVLTTPFMAAIVVVIYFDLRVRKEGFDLQMLSQQVTGTAPAASSDEFPPPEASGDDASGSGEAWPPPTD